MIPKASILDCWRMKNGLYGVCFYSGSWSTIQEICHFGTLPRKGLWIKSSSVCFFLEEKNVDRIWCNARISKSGFYQKFGMTGTAVTFEKEGIGYVVMERFSKVKGFDFNPKNN